MAEKSFPWTTNNNGDGPSGGYGSDRLQEAFIAIANGANTTAAVLAGMLNEFAVTTGGTTNVSVASGWSLVNGTVHLSDAATTVAIPTPSTSTRLDRIVLRWTASTTQTVRIMRLANTEGVGTDVALTQNSTTWDIPLARVTITTGGAITVTDQRAFVKSTGVRGVADNVTIAWDTSTKTIGVKANSLTASHITTGDISLPGGITSTKSGGGPSGGLSVVAAQPAYTWFASTAAANNKVWDASVFNNGSNETWNLRAVNDANSSASTALSIIRSGATVTNVNFPAGAVGITSTLQVGGAASVTGAFTVVGEIYRVPKLLWRQGGHATNWNTVGTTNYQPDNVRMYTGVVAVAFSSAFNGTSGTLTFPVTFTAIPNITYSVLDKKVGSVTNAQTVISLSATSLTAADVVINAASPTSLNGSIDVSWTAIGPI